MPAFVVEPISDPLLPYLEFARTRYWLFAARFVLFLLCGHGALYAFCIGSFAGALYVLWNYIWYFGAAIAAGFLIGIGIAFKNYLWFPAPEPPFLGISVAAAPAIKDLAKEVLGTKRARFVEHIRIAEVATFTSFGEEGTGVVNVSRRELRIGLPLLLLLPWKHIKVLLAQALLAHERDQLVVAWARQVDCCWSQLRQDFDATERSLLRLPLLKFAAWYLERLRLQSAALHYAQLIRADLGAAARFGKLTMAEALLAVHVAGRYFDSVFWPAYWEGARSSATPRENPYHVLQEDSAKPWPPKSARDWLQDQTIAAHPFDGCVPAIGLRLKALGFSAREAEGIDLTQWRPDTQATGLLLGGGSDRVFEGLFDHWKRMHQFEWTTKFETALSARRSLAELERTMAERPLSEEEAVMQVNWTLAASGLAVARPLLERLVKSYPGNAELSFDMGCLLLSDGDSAGADYLDKAVQLKPHFALDGASIGHAFLMQMGRPAEAIQFYLEKYFAHDRTLKLLDERSNLNATDTFLPHQCAPAAVEALKSTIRPVREITTAYLVSKKLTSGPEAFPLLGLVVDQRPSASMIENLRRHDRVRSQIEVPEGFRVVILAPDQRDLIRALRHVGGSELVRR